MPSPAEVIEIIADQLTKIKFGSDRARHRFLKFSLMQCDEKLDGLMAIQKLIASYFVTLVAWM
jgi:hypothetical protein